MPSSRQAGINDLDRLEDKLMDKLGRDEARGIVLSELQPVLSVLDAQV
jgi:hypothetical protein